MNQKTTTYEFPREDLFDIAGLCVPTAVSLHGSRPYSLLRLIITSTIQHHLNFM